MWICSTLGYFSIVQSDRDSNAFLVRTRTARDLDTLKAAVGIDKEIIVRPNTDYAARIIVNGEELGRIFSTLQSSIDYSNFKNTIYATPSQKDKSESYGEIWRVMYQYQSDNYDIG
jgi:hypothetical protein